MKRFYVGLVATLSALWSSSALALTKCGTVDIGTPGITCKAGNPIYGFIGFFINWAIGIVSLLAVLVIIISGIQYAASQGSPDAVKAAKSRLINAVVGLIMLSLTFVILRLLGIVG